MPPCIPGVNVFTDVLVVGAGPSGYMAGLTLVRYGIDVRIVDRRPVRVQRGFASGIYLLCNLYFDQVVTFSQACNLVCWKFCRLSISTTN